MHATINVRLDVSIDEDKTISAATVAEALADQEIEAQIYEQSLEALSEQLVEDYCGEKHARGNGEKRYQRAGTDERTVSTVVGDHELDLHYVKDTDEGRYFQPIREVLSFDGQNHYQEGLAFRAAKAATKLSFRDAAAQLAEFTADISRSTIHRHVRRFGQQLGEFLHESNAGSEAETVLADGTKCHSQQEEVSFHDVLPTLNRDVVGEDGETTLLDVSVDGSWSDTADGLRDTQTITEDAFLVSDAEEALVNAFCRGELGRHQLDLVHLPRTVGYHLWDDGAFPLPERKQIAAEVGADVRHLKNSVAKHRPAEEFAAISHRMETTRDRLQRLARQLEQLGSPETARYLRRWEPSILRFAELALQGRAIPWTSNAVERAMGEVAKRCKNQWMRSTAPGLKSILTLNLVKYANPSQFTAFEDELLGRATKTALSREVSASANRGEL
jgi:hypothetical protein